MKLTNLTMVVVLLGLASTISVAVARSARLDTIVPVVFSITPNPATPGQSVSMEVDPNQTTPNDQVVNISSSDSSNWSSLPSQVTVLAGHSSVTFSATVASGASGTLGATAACNGGSTSASALLQPGALSLDQTSDDMAFRAFGIPNDALSVMDATVPVVFSITPNPATPGQNVSLEVDLDQTTPVDQVVNISSSNSSNWSSLPSQVTVLAGHSSVTFSATVASGASGTLGATAACNGGSTSASALLQPGL